VTEAVIGVGGEHISIHRRQGPAFARFPQAGMLGLDTRIKQDDVGRFIRADDDGIVIQRQGCPAVQTT